MKSTSEYERSYTDEERQFLRKVDTYQQQSGKRFLTAIDYFILAKQLLKVGVEKPSKKIKKK